MTKDSEKQREYQRRYREKNREKRLAEGRVYRERNKDRLNAARRQRFADDPALREARRKNGRASYEKNKELWILGNIRTRAKKAGIPCTITVEDIRPPEFCPVLGIRLQRGNGRESGPLPNSPAVDRIVPELGYVPGNVLVVSHLANCIKQNAQPDQIRRVADFYERLLQERAIQELKGIVDA